MKSVLMVYLENNIMDLLPSQSDWSSSRAARFAQPRTPYFSDLVVPEVVMRRNVVRAVDGLPDLPQFKSTGIEAFSCGGLIVEENVIDQNFPWAVQFDNCGGTKFFANQNSAGALDPGYVYTPPPANPVVSISELST